MLAGLADNERFCYFLNTFVTQNSIQKDQFPANILVLLCICTTLYNETLRCCFAVGEKKNIKKLMINGKLVIEWIKEKSIKDVVVENICYD